MEICATIVQRDCLANQVDRQVAAAALVGDDAQKMQAVGVARINREDLPINTLRLRQPAGRRGVGSRPDSESVEH